MALHIFLLVLLLTVIPSVTYSYDFSEAINAIDSHVLVKSIELDAKALREKGSAKGSWGDPMFKLAFKNFPKDSLKNDETPMTGIEFGISQKIALTNKYGSIEESFKKLSHSKKYQQQDKQQELLKAFWNVLIENRRLDEEIKIIKENLSWIAKILRVSQRRYANGKISQQALLDIQIRKSELTAQLSNKLFEAKEQLDRLGYLLGLENSELEKSTIKWEIIETINLQKMDAREEALTSTVQAKEHLLSTMKLAYVPDLTLSLGYTKRADIDNRGDFVSAMISFPLPFSSVKYAEHSQAVFEKNSAEKKLSNYRKMKTSEINRLNHEIEKIEKELKILKQSTIKFAESSRAVTSKSYRYGNSTYVELLQSELKLQELLIKESRLTALLAKKKVAYKYLNGESLRE